jgi:hypothetical protein
MRREGDAISFAIAHGAKLRMENSEREKARQNVTGKKPYRKPEVRFESVFEVSALACGKVFTGTQHDCHFNRKAS